MKAQEMSEQEREIIAHLQSLAKALEAVEGAVAQFITEWNAAVTAGYLEREARKRDKGER